MARIVVVHGIGKQVEGEFTMGWFEALRSGVAEARGPRLTEDDVKAAFYGSVFRKKYSKSVGDRPYTAVDVKDDEAELLAAWWAAAAAADPTVPPPHRTDTKGRTSPWVQKALNALSRSTFFAGVAENLMIADVKQVALYLRDVETRKEIQARVSATIDDDTRVVVGHSLGSVVAYEVLAGWRGSCPVRTFVTLGSPLGIANIVFDKLTPRPVDGTGVWPSGLNQWHNIADPGDVVALVKELKPLWGPGVTDWLVHNGPRAHDAMPYLTAKETGDAITTGLEP
ncbi:hypothetical protein ACIA5G_52075 [Amycolatopsis sp. NPDC051758]|uniref:hypothetical protein n=1 Tax=Amycolatopsis sp. NPDC051758 TaxID=3363935 RepID=UPI0037AD65A6